MITISPLFIQMMEQGVGVGGGDEDKVKLAQHPSPFAFLWYGEVLVSLVTHRLL